MPASFTSASYTPDYLIASDADDILGEKITLITGQNLKRGAVLGKITASGKYNLSLAAAADGSQTPDMILAEDTDATAADKQTVAYTSGRFMAEKLIFGTGHSLATVKDTLRDKNILLETTVA